MNTEDIAREIVRIKNRLQELDTQLEGAVGTDLEDERKTLEDRKRHLQDLLSGHGAGDHAKQDKPAVSEDVRYVPPA